MCKNGYKTVALNSVSIDIDSGQFVLIYGPSGSEKSTLLHIPAVIDIPTIKSNQELVINGTSLLHMSDALRYE